MGSFELFSAQCLVVPARPGSKGRLSRPQPSPGWPSACRESGRSCNGRRARLSPQPGSPASSRSPSDSRVNRRMNVRIVRLFRSTCDVHIVRSWLSFIPWTPRRSRADYLRRRVGHRGVPVVLNDGPELHIGAEGQINRLRIGRKAVRADLRDRLDSLPALKAWASLSCGL